MTKNNYLLFLQRWNSWLFKNITTCCNKQITTKSFTWKRIKSYISSTLTAICGRRFSTPPPICVKSRRGTWESEREGGWGRQSRCGLREGRGKKEKGEIHLCQGYFSLKGGRTGRRERKVETGHWGMRWGQEGEKSVSGILWEGEKSPPTHTQHRVTDTQTDR